MVLMDIKMPEMNGYEAVKEIRKLNTDLPIIAVTAYAMSSDRENAINAGCNDYVSKPIMPPELFEAISKYVELNQK
ncbi:MAG: response regulator [Salinivirgaceae bacterium]|jgi:two-component system cell cycle response regulator DivK|nr:response regulator [Salinivirgaceae bacterium]